MNDNELLQTTNNNLKLDELTLPVPKQEFGQSFLTYIRTDKANNDSFLVAVLVIFIGLIFILFGTSGVQHGLHSPIFYALFAIGSFGILGSILRFRHIYKKYIREQELRAHLRKFASANSFKYLASSDKNEENQSGIRLHNRQSRVVRNVVITPTYQIGSCYVTTSTMQLGFMHTSGDATLGYNVGFVAISLPKSVPAMFLKTKQKHDKTPLPETFLSEQILSIGGEFDRFFTLYIPTEHHNIAQSILTLSIIQSLISHENSYDIEFRGDKMYIYLNKPWLDDPKLWEWVNSLSSTVRLAADSLHLNQDNYA
jgi:hypothetical protein